MTDLGQVIDVVEQANRTTGVVVRELLTNGKGGSADLTLHNAEGADWKITVKCSQVRTKRAATTTKKLTKKKVAKKTTRRVRRK